VIGGECWVVMISKYWVVSGECWVVMISSIRC